MDQVAGDPEWFPHPVRIIGWFIACGERSLRHTHDSPAQEVRTGALLTTAVVICTYGLTHLCISAAYRYSDRAGTCVEATLGWTCLAARNLQQEATAVTTAVSLQDLPLARLRLARIVGRDTARLPVEEISRAVIETVSESASDGFVAPLLYLALGGVPLAMAYKAVNTLDSMIGHTDVRYLHFGRFAARLDDAANYLPARLTAASITLAACLFPGTDANAAWRTWQRDGGKHKSPNAGQPESAVAGALHVRLGGTNTYAGEAVSAAVLGHEFEQPGMKKAQQSIQLLAAVVVITTTVALLCTARWSNQPS